MVKTSGNRNSYYHVCNIPQRQHENRNNPVNPEKILNLRNDLISLQKIENPPPAKKLSNCISDKPMYLLYASPTQQAATSPSYTAQRKWLDHALLLHQERTSFVLQVCAEPHQKLNGVGQTELEILLFLFYSFSSKPQSTQLHNFTWQSFIQNFFINIIVVYLLHVRLNPEFQ